MAKISGIPMTVGVDISVGGAAKAIENDITSLDFGIPRGVQDSTGVNSAAMERILLLADFTITLNGVFNVATDLSHDVFKAVSSIGGVRTVTIVVGGKTLPNECIFTDYALSRSASGELTWTAPGLLSSTVVPTWA